MIKCSFVYAAAGHGCRITEGLRQGEGSGKVEQKDKNQDMILNRLFAMADAEYKAFHSRLMPTIDPDRIIGVRTPALRRLAKELKGSAEAEAFLSVLPHTYYEENNLHAFLIEAEKSYEACIERLDVFLPFIDNWATCDMLSPKVVKNYPERFLVKIREWMDAEHVYTKRFGIGMLMRYYLEDWFLPEYLGWVAAIRSDAYYINMMVAWFFATALAKQYDETIIYLQQKRLPEWTHNKAIQKAIESNRISGEQKDYLRTLKVRSEKEKKQAKGEIGYENRKQDI